MRASNICTLLLASIAAARPAIFDEFSADGSMGGAGGGVSDTAADSDAIHPGDSAPIEDGHGGSVADTVADTVANPPVSKSVADIEGADRIVVGYRVVIKVRLLLLLLFPLSMTYVSICILTEGNPTPERSRKNKCCGNPHPTRFVRQNRAQPRWRRLSDPVARHL